MPARDIYHNAVKNALIKDGWTITDDPLTLGIGGATVFVDLGAEQVLGAEKGRVKLPLRSRHFVAPLE